MRRAVAALAAVLGLAAGVPAPAMSNARPVKATLTLGADPLQCGRPRGSVVVTFPAAVTLPRTIAAAAGPGGGTGRTERPRRDRDRAARAGNHVHVDHPRPARTW